jgi:uncharacterized protein (TIGR02598 family)
MDAGSPLPVCHAVPLCLRINFSSPRPFAGSPGNFLPAEARGKGRFAARSGFTLVEVAMAIGIAAFAFVALLGLIPTGMSTFRGAVDTANEAWIAQNLHSMVQVTEWEEVDKLDHSQSQEIYYYDEEGRLTDTERNSGDVNVRAQRLYGAKLLIEKLFQPDETPSDEMRRGRRVVVVIANVVNPKAKEAFDGITTAEDIGKVPPGVPVRARAFVVMQMDSDSSTTQVANP